MTDPPPAVLAAVISCTDRAIPTPRQAQEGEVSENETPGRVVLGVVGELPDGPYLGVPVTAPTPAGQARADRGEAEDPVVRDFARAWMRHQGYPDEWIAAGEQQTHQSAGCEFDSNSMSWQCMDELHQSLHPERDSVEDATYFAHFAVEFFASPTDEEITERVAQTLWDAVRLDTPWVHLNNYTRNTYRRMADAAVEVLRGEGR